MKAMMNMNKHIVTKTNEEIMIMLMQPTLLNNEVVHYYVNVGGLKEDVLGSEELISENNVDGSQLLVDPHFQQCTTPLMSFMRLPVERGEQ